MSLAKECFSYDIERILEVLLCFTREPDYYICRNTEVRIVFTQSFYDFQVFLQSLLLGRISKSKLKTAKIPVNTALIKMIFVR